MSLLVILLAFFLGASKASADSLHLAVASNFIAPIKQLAPVFEKETGHTLRLSFGSSGKFFAQIQNNAPYDIFLSADTQKPLALVSHQLALPESIAIYAKGQLALWSMTPLRAPSLQALLQDAKRIAIANPKLAPYGKAAVESMTNLSMWEQSQTKLVQGENIGQTYQFTYSQNADLGFVALSQVIAKPNLGYVRNLPSELYNEIQQAGVILSRSRNIELAQTFMAFLMRTDIQARIAQFGYATE
ncbi:molybdate ABC transporter substrate-binding protein [Marinomonas profundi]|nr:molybdate ABC transporter substrate-binding protein [Marinomonas profundi]UDV03600.1 molybdate ABC transporter substrate-binding protein [Marinomonas profundi]